MKDNKSCLLPLILALALLSSCVSLSNLGPFDPPEYPLTEKSIELLDTRVVYVEAGKGDPVIFLHGAGGALVDWELILPFFAEHYHTIALDQPGYGKSEKRLDYPYSIDNSARIVEALLDAKGIEKAHIIGNSFGGTVAAYFAVNFPQRVEKLVLVDAAAALAIPHVGLPQIFRLIGKPVFMISNSLGTNDPHAQNPERVQPNIARAIMESDEVWGCREAWVDDIADNIKLKLKPELNKIQAPTLVIWGENDELLLVHDNWAIWERVPNSELLLMHGADHTPQLSAPREFEAAVHAFLQGLPNPDYAIRGKKVRYR